MTKLPEREEDGGIDWDRYMEDVTPEVLRQHYIEIAQLAVAHTIERCAKVADEHCVFHESRAKSDTEAYGRAALDIREAIRKLEV